MGTVTQLLNRPEQLTDTSSLVDETGRPGHVSLGGRLLCFLGFHRYDWRSVKVMGHSNEADHDEFGFDYWIEDQYRCKRAGCTMGRRWFVANRERSKPW